MSEASSGIRYWNERYAGGGYDGEPPVTFVDEIVDTVLAELGPDAKGLYVGCGDGRNFIPLVDKGLDIHGIDPSGKGIAGLRKKRPDMRKRTEIAAFEDYPEGDTFDYIVALQAFQHGHGSTIEDHFSHTRSRLRVGGLFFLRVNSTGTQIVEPHERYPADEHDAFSVRYTAKHKRSMQIHFFTPSELSQMAADHSFEVTKGFREETMPREDGTSWKQWEAIWRAT